MVVKRSLLLIGVVLVAVMATVGLTSCGSGPVAATASAWTGEVLTTPVAKPEVVLTDTSGQSYDLDKQTKGKVTLIYFGYTHCPDLCPTIMAVMGNALRMLTPQQQSQVAVVFITTDPARDTPAVIRAWLDKYNSEIIGLTGTTAELTLAQVDFSLPVASPSDLPGGGYVVEHSSLLPVFSRDNKSHMIYLATTQLSAAGVAADLRRLITGRIPS